MERIAVLGCGGSGKTTLARELGRRFGLPVVHVDFVVHAEPGHVERPELELLERHAADTEIVVLRSRRQVRRWLATRSCPQGGAPGGSAPADGRAGGTRP